MMKAPITYIQAGELLKQHSEILLDPTDAIPFESDPRWTKAFPERPGVYPLFQASALVYVGETGNLRARMSDIRRTMNHTVRRTIGAFLFCEHKEFEPATSKKKFSPTLEKKLDSWMSLHIAIKPTPIAFGRAEIEDYLVSEFRPKFNKKLPRKIKG